ncbi:MAG: hypothetical protein AAF658_06105, partial [Myxococcota bacterium]
RELVKSDVKPAQPLAERRAQHEFLERSRRTTRRMLAVSSALYVLCAMFALVVALVVETEFRLPNETWSELAHGAFFFAFMFPAVSVLALIIGWGLYASENYVAGMVASLVPWLWGVGGLVLSLGVGLLS